MTSFDQFAIRFFGFVLTLMVTVGVVGMASATIFQWHELDVNKDIAFARMQTDVELTTLKVDAKKRMHKERLDFISDLGEKEMTLYLLSE